MLNCKIVSVITSNILDYLSRQLINIANKMASKRGPYKMKHIKQDNENESCIEPEITSDSDEELINIDFDCNTTSVGKRRKRKYKSINDHIFVEQVVQSSSSDSDNDDALHMPPQEHPENSKDDTFQDLTISDTEVEDTNDIMEDSFALHNVSSDSENDEDDIFLNLDSDNDIDIEMEDLEEIFENDHDADLDPLFEGASVTVGAIMLILALFVTKHSLSGDGIEQLLKILALVLPQENRLCTSVNAFKVFFRNLKNPLVKHYYCGHCLGYIKDSKQEICPYSKCNRPLPQKKNYFLEMPIKNQLNKLFSQKEFYSNLQGRFSRDNGKYYDIYDGNLYKSYFENGGPLSNPNNISFTFNTDGASVFKSSNMSVWPLFMVINELPYSLRMKKDNMILAGLWFGNKKPAMGGFLHPFLNTFKELERGIDMHSPDKEDTFSLKAFLLCGTADLPARSILCNCVQYNGSYSCWKCIQKGETAKVGKGHTHVFPYIDEQPKEPFRTKESVIRDSQTAFNLQDTGSKAFITNGIKGPSWLTFFPNFEIVLGIAIDYMHGVLLGTQKLLLTLWFSETHKGKEFSFFNQISAVDKRLLQIKPTSSISRLPRTISRELKYWKASEYRSFMLYYGAPVLNGILDQDRMIHYLLLVNAMFILLKSGSTEEEILKAEMLLFQFVKTFHILYDKCYMTLNIHQLLHLADSVRDLGPLYTHSCFSFEDKNGVLLKMIRGTQNIDNQIITGVSFLQKLPELKQSTLEKGSHLENLYNSIENPNILKRGTELEKNVYILGAIKEKTPTEEEHSALCDALGYAPVLNKLKSFKRLEFHGSLIYGTDYSRMVKRDNSTICYRNFGENNEMFAKVIHFILVEEENDLQCFAIANELQCVNYSKDDNIFKVDNLKKIKAIPVLSIVQSCVYIMVQDTPNLYYVCKLPNNLESD